MQWKGIGSGGMEKKRFGFWGFWERLKDQERVAKGGESALDGDGEDGERGHRFFTLSPRSEFIYTDIAT